MQQTQTVQVRAGRPEDDLALLAMLCALSAHSGFFRFLTGLGLPSSALVRALLACDERRGALVAVAQVEGHEQVVGHACWAVSTAGAVDVGVVVADAWQRQGTGRRLVAGALERAAATGATGLHLDVHPENRNVLGTLRRRLPSAQARLRDGLVQFDVDIEAALDAVDDRRDPLPGRAVPLEPPQHTLLLESTHS